MIKIKWEDITGYEGLYEINNQGDVYSLSKFDRFRRYREGKKLKPSFGVDGYFQIGLYKMGKRRYYKVHRLFTNWIDSRKRAASIL